MEAVVSASGLCKTFAAGETRIEVLRDVQLQVGRGEVVAVAGSSGSGKSTLLHILGGLLHPDAGRAEIAGREVFALGEGERAELRNRHVGFVYQMHHLLPEFSALENVMMPAWIAGTSARQAEPRARSLLDAMGLGNRLKHKPGELSGGEQQRVAVARALVNEPEVVLADEPSGNLDAESSAALHALLLEWASRAGQAFLIATHSRELARQAHRTLVLRGGTLSPATEGWR